MKKIILLLLFAGISQVTFANPADSLQKSKLQESLDIYHQAIKYNDMGTAAYALTNYLYAGGDATYRDSLALVYYTGNNLNGAYRLANEIYTADNKNTTALSLLADVSSRAGETKASLDWYEKLCALKPTPYNYYQLASKQYMLERKLECRQSLQKALADSTEATKQQVSLEVSNGYFEQVPVTAAAYNMLGVMAFQDKKTADAEFFYKKAVAAAPDFAIGKQNLESMKQGAAKTAPKTAKKVAGN